MKTSTILLFTLLNLVVVCKSDEFLKQPEESIVYEGNTIRLECKVKAGNLVQWVIDTYGHSENISKNNISGIKPLRRGYSWEPDAPDGNHDLLIRADSAHMGGYTCEIPSLRESAPKVKLHVMSNNDPVFLVIPQNTRLTDGQATLKCQVSTRVLPGTVTLKWRVLKAGGKLLTLATVKRKKITAPLDFNLNVTGTGTYMIEAYHLYNVFTNAWIVFNVTVKSELKVAG